MPLNDWLVQVPLSQLVELQGMTVELNELRNENKKLKNRVEGLHRTLFECIEKLGEIKREIRLECQ